MPKEKMYRSDIPPNFPGNYRIRDADEDIVYWGYSENLYDTWQEKILNHSFWNCNMFEYAPERLIEE